MKLIRVGLPMWLLVAEALHAGTVLSIQMRGAADISTPPVVRARYLAARMLAAVGVDIEWCTSARKCTNWAERIVVTLEPSAPSSLPFTAIAAAHVYQGHRIQLFLDRIKRLTAQAPAAQVLAHVLVHEVTHLLQNCDHHSKSGVMRSRWDKEDFATMARSTLPFTDEDVDLIQLGLDKRLGRHVLNLHEQ